MIKKSLSNFPVAVECYKCPLYSDGFCHIDNRKAVCDRYSGKIIELPDIMWSAACRVILHMDLEIQPVRRAEIIDMECIIDFNDGNGEDDNE